MSANLKTKLVGAVIEEFPYMVINGVIENDFDEFVDEDIKTIFDWNQKKWVGGADEQAGAY